MKRHFGDGRQTITTASSPLYGTTDMDDHEPNVLDAHYGETDLPAFAKEQARRGNYYNAYKAQADHICALEAKVAGLEGALRPFAEAAEKGKTVYEGMKALRGSEHYPFTFTTAFIGGGVATAQSFVSWSDWDRARTTLAGKGEGV